MNAASVRRREALTTASGLDFIPPIVRRFLAVERDADSCWMWDGSVNGNGHGQVNFRRGGEKGGTGAHRLIYLLLVGDLPPGLSLDHLCRVRACVNPRHLEPVPQRTNVLRGLSGPAQNATKTHCPRGHEYAGANLRVSRDGRRYCRVCQTTLARERYARRNAS